MVRGGTRRAGLTATPRGGPATARGGPSRQPGTKPRAASRAVCVPNYSRRVARPRPPGTERRGRPAASGCWAQRQQRERACWQCGCLGLATCCCCMRHVPVAPDSRYPPVITAAVQPAPCSSPVHVRRWCRSLVCCVTSTVTSTALCCATSMSMGGWFSAGHGEDDERLAHLPAGPRGCLYSPSCFMALFAVSTG